MIHFFSGLTYIDIMNLDIRSYDRLNMIINAFCWVVMDKQSQLVVNLSKYIALVNPVRNEYLKEKINDDNLFEYQEKFAMKFGLIYVSHYYKVMADTGGISDNIRLRHDINNISSLAAYNHDRTFDIDMTDDMKNNILRSEYSLPTYINNNEIHDVDYFMNIGLDKESIIKVLDRSTVFYRCPSKTIDMLFRLYNYNEPVQA